MSREKEMTGRPNPSDKGAMQVLCLGMGRTGTTSLTAALQILGYTKVYDNWNAVLPNDDSDTWHEAIKAKFDRGEKIDFTDGVMFDVLENYEAILDLPGALFYQELLEAYPDAKVILTVRDVTAWSKSMKATLVHPRETGVSVWMAKLLNGRFRRWHDMFMAMHRAYVHDDFDRHGARAFADHNRAVRRLVPADRLLEFSAADGWEPLCRFLGKPVPVNEPYPRKHTTDFYTQGYRGWIWYWCKSGLRENAPQLGTAAAVAAIGFAWLVAKRR